MTDVKQMSNNYLIAEHEKLIHKSAILDAKLLDDLVANNYRDEVREKLVATMNMSLKTRNEILSRMDKGTKE